MTGRARQVQCMQCSLNIEREEFQHILRSLNPHMSNVATQEVRPDGDVELSEVC